VHTHAKVSDKATGEACCHQVRTDVRHHFCLPQAFLDFDREAIEKKAEKYVKIAVTFVVKRLILITSIIVLVLVNREITDDVHKLLQEAQETCSATMSNRICRRERNVTRVSLTHDMKKEKQLCLDDLKKKDWFLAVP